MSYKFEIPKQQLSNLWRARQYIGRGPIAAQVRNAVDSYLETLEQEIGAPIAEIAEIVERHEQEAIATELPM